MYLELSVLLRDVSGRMCPGPGPPVAPNPSAVQRCSIRALGVHILFCVGEMTYVDSGR